MRAPIPHSPWARLAILCLVIAAAIGLVLWHGPDRGVIAEAFQAVSWVWVAIAVLINLSPDHLDRHASFDEYARAKSRIFENQGPDDWAIVNADDPAAMSVAEPARARRFDFGLNATPRDGMNRPTCSRSWPVWQVGPEELVTARDTETFTPSYTAQREGRLSARCIVDGVRSGWLFFDLVER